ncbi:hypothetical protein AB205_0020940 [Aquarana catesbeiana]|uniref:Uncharacterized protein n=1 Tax=Aquarana catesbeiana TaxID=8400 RepID=A0A2G9PJA7_AQUCT|nr:hypothetical protein AB205_0020940 [Aquarana catesbeiana]
MNDSDDFWEMITGVHFVLHSGARFRLMSLSQSWLWKDPDFTVRIHSDVWAGSWLCLSASLWETELTTPAPSTAQLLSERWRGRAESQ